MHYHALAVDYDGTLATHGTVDEATLAALKRLKESGRRLVLVTGRTLEPLLEAFPEIAICDLVVAENGALIYDPKTSDERTLGEPPPSTLLGRLAERGVPQLEIGRVVVATWTPHEQVTLDTIRELGLELQIIFNKGAVMVLPTGINKATGLRCALEQLKLSAHNTVGVGDAENDEAFLRLCDIGAAVENALPAVKERADIVTEGARGAGVTEVIDRLLADDFCDFRGRPERGVLLGYLLDGREFRVPLSDVRVLVTGDPAGGKSKFALTMLHQLMELDYQTCIIDPEGDYQTLEGAIVLGTREQSPAVEEVLHVLDRPQENCVVSLFGTEAEEQPPLFDKLLRALLEHRSRTGRPHWIVIDEAHYPLPAKWQSAERLNTKELGGVMLITAYPDRLPQFLLKSIDLIVAIGDDLAKTLEHVGEVLGEEQPQLAPPADEKEHRAVAWWRTAGRARSRSGREIARETATWIRRIEPKGDHHRHKHTYLDGDMDAHLRFHFRGPKGELNLQAQNLRIFMQLGEGVDVETWMFHLKQHDYANWFRDVIHDNELAKLADELADDQNLSPRDSRARLFDHIRRRYEP
jgi:hydroxymethylpyrimidine pyrophosphatase-like HAD family hydrolase